MKITHKVSEKKESQNQKIGIDIRNKESFNLLPFTDEELDESLSESKGSSPGLR
jgi:hypothetical protein